MRWYINRVGTAEGLFDEPQVVTMIQNRELVLANVCREGGSSWIPLEEHPPFRAARPPNTLPGVSASEVLFGFDRSGPAAEMAQALAESKRVATVIRKLPGLGSLGLIVLGLLFALAGPTLQLMPLTGLGLGMIVFAVVAYLFLSPFLGFKSPENAVAAANLVGAIRWAGPVSVNVSFQEPAQYLRHAKSLRRVSIIGRTHVGSEVQIVVRQHKSVKRTGYQRSLHSCSDIVEVSVRSAAGAEVRHQESRRPGLAPPLGPPIVQHLHGQLGLGSPLAGK